MAGEARNPGALEAPYDLMQELALLDAGSARLWTDDYDELYLRVDGGQARGPLTAHRAFPLSMADEFVSLRDREGGEVAVIRRLADLDADSRAAVESILEWTYFASEITAVHAVEVRFHIPHWDVETDRGRRTIEMASSRRDIRVLPDGRALIRDADGNLYEIPSVTRLDADSRALVEDYL